MVIMTAKVPKRKLLIVLILVIAAVVVGILVNNANAAETPPAPTAVSSDSIKTNEDRIAFLQSYGWEVKAEPVQTQEVRIPTEPGEVFLRYNELQLSQNYDLNQYAGKTVKRYVYEITNYPDESGVYRATVLIYKNSVIGGDVCSDAQGGVMHGFAKPK